jgi:hypothetical protein
MRRKNVRSSLIITVRDFLWFPHLVRSAPRRPDRGTDFRNWGAKRFLAPPATGVNDRTSCRSSSSQSSRRLESSSAERCANIGQTLISFPGAGLENAIISIALTAWPSIARLARAETLTIRSADHVPAARMQGDSSLRIIVKSIVPMCIPSVLVRLTLSRATVILTATDLGFLGLGAQPPMPEWGR